MTRIEEIKNRAEKLTKFSTWPTAAEILELMAVVPELLAEVDGAWSKGFQQGAENEHENTLAMYKRAEAADAKVEAAEKLAQALLDDLRAIQPLAWQDLHNSKPYGNHGAVCQSIDACIEELAAYRKTTGE